MWPPRKLNEGDLLFTYTDGVNEAKNEKGEQFTERRISWNTLLPREITRRNFSVSCLTTSRNFAVQLPSPTILRCLR